MMADQQAAYSAAIADGAEAGVTIRVDGVATAQSRAADEPAGGRARCSRRSRGDLADPAAVQGGGMEGIELREAAHGGATTLWGVTYRPWSPVASRAPASVPAAQLAARTAAQPHRQAVAEAPGAERRPAAAPATEGHDGSERPSRRQSSERNPDSERSERNPGSERLSTRQSSERSIRPERVSASAPAPEQPAGTDQPSVRRPRLPAAPPLPEPPSNLGDALPDAPAGAEASGEPQTPPGGVSRYTLAELTDIAFPIGTEANGGASSSSARAPSSRRSKSSKSSKRSKGPKPRDGSRYAAPASAPADAAGPSDAPCTSREDGTQRQVGEDIHPTATQ